jgi:hypothetical protein
MDNASHSVPRPAAGLIARLQHWLGLARTAHPLKLPSPLSNPGSASAGAKARPQNLAGRWPDSESFLTYRIADTHSNAASDGKSDHPPDGLNA